MLSCITGYYLICFYYLIYASLVAQLIKKTICNAGDLGSIPGLGGSPGGGHGNPFQYPCLENPHGQRSLVGYSPGGLKESDTTEWLSTAHYLISPWEQASRGADTTSELSERLKITAAARKESSLTQNMSQQKPGYCGRNNLQIWDSVIRAVPYYHPLHLVLC